MSTLNQVKPARVLLSSIILLLVSTSQITLAGQVEYLTSPAGKALNLPFSEAVRAGNTLYLSGQLGNKPGTFELVEGGIGPETRQTMENISAALQRHGSNLQELVKCTIYLADIKEWEAMNEVYKTFFSDHYPARAAVGGSGLAIGARVEIDCIAVTGN